MVKTDTIIPSQILVQPHKEQKKVATGLEYVIERMDWFIALSEVVMNSFNWLMKWPRSLFCCKSLAKYFGSRANISQLVLILD